MLLSLFMRMVMKRMGFEKVVCLSFCRMDERRVRWAKHS